MNCLQFGGECNPQCCTYPCNTLRGYHKGRITAIDEFKNKLIELYHKRYMHDIYLDDIDSIVEELKGEE